jgi:hypothetical protein
MWHFVIRLFAKGSALPEVERAAILAATFPLIWMSSAAALPGSDHRLFDEGRTCLCRDVSF